MSCAELDRDLVLDIYAALDKRGLKLLLYWTGDGPHEDHQASAGMGMPGKLTCSSHAICRCGCDLRVYFERLLVIACDYSLPGH